MMNMVFHTKETNRQQKDALRKRNLSAKVMSYKMGEQANAIGQANTTVKNMFASPMIERVVKAKSGCSACGR